MALFVGICIKLFGMAVSIMGLWALTLLGWYGFGLRDGAMLAYGLACVALCMLPYIAADLVARDIFRAYARKREA